MTIHIGAHMMARSLVLFAPRAMMRLLVTTNQSLESSCFRDNSTRRNIDSYWVNAYVEIGEVKKL